LDANGDGITDSAKTITQAFDRADNLLLKMEAVDDDGNGTPNSITTLHQTFDNRGNLLTSVLREDFNADGDPELITTITQSFDTQRPSPSIHVEPDRDSECYNTLSKYRSKNNFLNCAGRGRGGTVSTFCMHIFVSEYSVRINS